MTEHWRPVRGYEGFYEVSDLGRVRSVDRTDIRGRRLRGRNLKLRPLPDGRPRVNLSRDGNIRDAYTYVLMLEAFVGPRPPGQEALHWDDDLSNNALGNLRWGTKTDNMRDMARNGRGNVALTHCPSGHPYDDANTYFYPRGRQHRGCRACGRERGPEKRRRVAGRKAAA